MALESGVEVVVDSGSVPILDGVRELAEAGFVPGGSARNLKWVADRLDRGDLDDITVTLLGDAQTSGGLVFGVDPARADEVVAELASTGHSAAVIGAATGGAGGRITLR
jgi:selenide,water dikinase